MMPLIGESLDFSFLKQHFKATLEQYYVSEGQHEQIIFTLL